MQLRRLLLLVRLEIAGELVVAHGRARDPARRGRQLLADAEADQPFEHRPVPLLAPAEVDEVAQAAHRVEAAAGRALLQHADQPVLGQRGVEDGQGQRIGEGDGERRLGEQEELLQRQEQERGGQVGDPQVDPQGGHGRR